MPSLLLDNSPLLLTFVFKIKALYKTSDCETLMISDKTKCAQQLYSVPQSWPCNISRIRYFYVESTCRRFFRDMDIGSTQFVATIPTSLYFHATPCTVLVSSLYQAQVRIANRAYHFQQIVSFVSQNEGYSLGLDHPIGIPASRTDTPTPQIKTTPANRGYPLTLKPDSGG